MRVSVRASTWQSSHEGWGCLDCKNDWDRSDVPVELPTELNQWGTKESAGDPLEWRNVSVTHFIRLPNTYQWSFLHFLITHQWKGPAPYDGRSEQFLSKGHLMIHFHFQWALWGRSLAYISTYGLSPAIQIYSMKIMKKGNGNDFYECPHRFLSGVPSFPWFLSLFLKNEHLKRIPSCVRIPLL